MKSKVNARASWTGLGLSACAVFLLSACGGSNNLNQTQQQNAMQAVSYVANAEDKALAATSADSFTVNPASQFKGFNHGMWNRPRSWVECDCGSEDKKSASSPPWSGKPS